MSRQGSRPEERGEPLDVARLLRASDGRPRLSIVYTAHLSDEERLFVTALLLDKVKTWMRRQGGTTQLRALVYMDEIYGYFPPHPANPPTKRPLLTLLKQARAQGVSVVLATQNYFSRYGGELADPYLLVKYAVRYKDAGETVGVRAYALNAASATEVLESEPLAVDESALTAQPAKPVRHAELPDWLAGAGGRGVEKALRAEVAELEGDLGGPGGVDLERLQARAGVPSRTDVKVLRYDLVWVY